MRYIHKECGGEIKSPLQKTAICLACGKSTDNWELSDDGRYRIHFQTRKEIALSKQEQKTARKMTGRESRTSKQTKAQTAKKK